MSSTIRISLVLLLAATVAVSGCERGDTSGESSGPAAAEEAGGGGITDLPGQIDPAPLPADRSQVVVREDIEVSGEPACAMTVRYADQLEQEITWNGEPCAEISFGFRTIEDLEKIGQADKLDEETREDVSRLSGGRVLYVEGRFSSAIYPLNVAGFPREVWLAD